MRRVLTVTAILLVLTAPLLFDAQTALASNDPFWSRQWGMQKIGAETAWSSGTGRGIVIGVVDSGVDLAHPDLASKIVTGYDFVDRDNRPQDGDGHGTHVAGIAAALTNNGVGVAGVAPDASIMPIRIFDDNGRAQAGLDAGIRAAVDRGAHVINVSASELGQELGENDEFFGPSFTEAIRYAWAKGAIVVMAAGNRYLLGSGYSPDTPAFVVSATNRNDGKPDFSNGVGQSRWGIAAPGGGSTTDAQSGDIYSTYIPNAYDYAAGTSMSAPHVSGAAAVLRSMGLSPQATVDRLLATADDIGSPGRDDVFGAGRLNVGKAVAGLGKSPSSGTGPSNPAASPPTQRRSAPARQPGAPAPATSVSPPSAPVQREAPTVGPSASPPTVQVRSASRSSVDDDPDWWLPILALVLAVTVGSAAISRRSARSDT